MIMFSYHFPPYFKKANSIYIYIYPHMYTETYIYIYIFAFTLMNNLEDSYKPGLLVISYLRYFNEAFDRA